MFIILATQEVEVGKGGWQFETSPGKVSVRLYLKNKLKKKKEEAE
jgi:hypothetical protein